MMCVCAQLQVDIKIVKYYFGEFKIDVTFKFDKKYYLRTPLKTRTIK